jgi:hypothetical protein
LEDRASQRCRFQLNEHVEAEDLAKVLSPDHGVGEPIAGLDVTLGGVGLTARRAVVEHHGDFIRIRFIEPE